VQDTTLRRLLKEMRLTRQRLPAQVELLVELLKVSELRSIRDTKANLKQLSWPRELYTPQRICHQQQLAILAQSTLRGTLQGQSFTAYQVQATRPSQLLVELSHQLQLWPALQEVHPARSRSSCQCRRSRPQLTSLPRLKPPPKRLLLRIRLLAKFCSISLPLGTRPPLRLSAANLQPPPSHSLPQHLQAQLKVCPVRVTDL